MQTRTRKWVKNDLSEDPYRFHHATEAVLRCNSCCFTMQNSLRCSVTQAPLQPKRIFDCVLNLYTFRVNFVSLSFSTIYEHAHISPVRTEKIFGSEFLNLRGAIVRIIPNSSLQDIHKTTLMISDFLILRRLSSLYHHSILQYSIPFAAYSAFCHWESRYVHSAVLQLMHL